MITLRGHQGVTRSLARSFLVLVLDEVDKFIEKPDSDADGLFYTPSAENRDTRSWSGGEYRRLAPLEVVVRVKKNAGPERAGFKCGLMGLFGLGRV